MREDTREDTLVLAVDLDQDRWNKSYEKPRVVPGYQSRETGLSNKVSSNDSKHFVSPVTSLPYSGDLETSPFLPQSPKDQEYTDNLGTATLSKRLW